ncbi:ABC transporter substrate-binding protein [Halovenus sp. HT40]|uniref:ABC transporter substrate-binding protein n=1 Tax=Halovenus sp. HT40 TaxID=3126691 RepID=UPI00300F7974
MDPGTVSRRQTLRVAGVGAVAALAGCSGGDDDGTDNGEENGTTTSQGSADAFTIGVLQDITGANGPEFAHQGLAGLLSGFAYKNNRDSPLQLEDDPGSRINWSENGYGTDPAVVMEELNGEVLRYTVDDIEGAGSVEIEFLIRDTASDAETAASVATELIDQCDLLYGTSSSDGIVRVNNLILSQTDIPMFVGQGSTSQVTADSAQCRDQLFRTTENTAMVSRAGALNLVEDPDISKVALLGVDSSFGRDVISNYRQIFENEGSTEYIERFEPVGLVTEGWQEILQGLLGPEGSHTDTDAVVIGATGQTATFYAEAFLEGGYEQTTFSQAPSRLTFREVGESALDAVEAQTGSREISKFVVDNLLPFGPIACRYFWNQYDNEVNDWLTENHRAAYGVVPDMFTGSAFATASAIVQAFEAAGTADSSAILDEVPGMAVRDTPKGEEEYVFQEYNNQARSPVTIAEYTPRSEAKWSAALQPSEPINRIDKGLTTIPEDDPRMTCDLS